MSDSDHEIYPMPLFPQLTVSNLKKSTAWYETLGFEVIYSMPVMSHVRYRKYADIMLVAERDEDEDESWSETRTPRKHRPADAGSPRTSPSRTSPSTTWQAGPRRNGIEVAVPPHETNWNTRETTIHDPDGYELVFSERAETDADFEDVMGSVEE